MQLTNRHLVYLISLALLITLFGTAVNLSRLGIGIGGITGALTQTEGNASLTITSLLSINMSTGNISWGSGSVNNGQTAAVLDTSGAGYVSLGSWTPVGQGFIIENIGNVDINLSAKNTKSAATFLGGTNPAYNHTLTLLEASSCGTNQTIGNNSNVPNGVEVICGNFSWVDTKDIFEINLNLTVPYDSIQGYAQDIWNFTAAQKT